MAETALIPTPAAPSPTARATSAAVDWLLARQAPAGWWVGELETNATMTAEHVLLLRVLGLDADLARIREGAIRHLIGGQRDDGSWALHHDGPADLSTTAEAYAALRVLGLDAQSPELQRALRVVHEQGGVAEARVFTKVWLAMLGAYPWEGIPSMPPELVHLPSWAPLNLYDFAAWARGTIAPLLIVLSRRPVRDPGVGLAELIRPGTEPLLHRVPGHGPFLWLDHLQKLYEHLPRQPGRQRARTRIVDWVTARQERDGSWGGIQPPWVYSLIALHLEGMPLDHPTMRRGLQGLEGFALDDAAARGWRLQACMSPVWDTALSVIALRDAGLPADHEAIRRAAAWLLDQQIDTGGDWQVRAPDGPADCGGFAFEFENDTYPDVDDTALVVLALLRTEPSARRRRAVERATRWVLAMRSSNGGWAAFDRDNTRELVYSIPFADFGAMLDPPTDDVTAHVLEMLAATGSTPADPVVTQGLRVLRRSQRADGSWFGRWGVNHIYGSWCVVSALHALGTGSDMLERAARFVERHQNPDGGFGEGWISYSDESFAGVGASTPSQTAWAATTLRMASRAGIDARAVSAAADHNAAHARALRWLIGHQRPDGTWDEQLPTGTGFPRDFAINYHLYRHVFPLSALAGGIDPQEA